MATMFENRIDAGRQLAARFLDLRDRDDVIVLALTRGGVPVAVKPAQHRGLSPMTWERWPGFYIRARRHRR